MDCVKNPNLYEKHKITIFPTIKAFMYGRSVTFNGERDEQGLDLLKWVDLLKRDNLVTDFITAPVIVAGLQIGLDEYVESRLTPKSPVLLFLMDKETSPNPDMKKQFDFLCKKYVEEVSGCAIASVADAKKLKEFANVAIDSSPAFFLLRDFADEPQALAGPAAGTISSSSSSWDDEALNTWILFNVFPRVVPFREENDNWLFSARRGPGYKTHVLLYLDASLPESRKIMADARVVAAKFEGKCLITVADIKDVESGDEFVGGIVSDLRLIPANAPTAMIITSDKTKVTFFRLDLGTDLNTESLTHFVNAFLANKLVEVDLNDLNKE